MMNNTSNFQYNEEEIGNIELYNNPVIKKTDSAGQIPYMFDGNHYSAFGAEQVARKILSKIVQKI
ncbi:MAG: hypothetical protein L6262_11050 [Weeksellaceae bacterium]|nr:hypothetical protein [Weeksellaceae bacterium]